MRSLATRCARGAIAALCCWVAAAGSAGASQVGDVEVTAMGFGGTAPHAIQDALVNAVAQVNGEAVAASMKLTETSTTVSSTEKGDSREIERRLQEEISRKTRGVVKSWRVVSTQPSDAGDYTATVAARIAVLKTSEQMKRLKLAVVTPRGALQPYSGELQQAVTRELTTSRKFALLDRNNASAIEEQLDRIRKGGGQIADRVRLVSEAAPDLLAVVRVESADNGRGRTNLFGVLEVIDYSTRQVKFSERKVMVIDESRPASAVLRIGVLGKLLTRSVIETAFPPTVVGLGDGTITIAQGKDFFTAGDRLTLYALGAEIRDPHTNEFLSHERREIGAARVTHTDARITQAALDAGLRIDAALIAARKVVVARDLSETDGDAASAPGTPRKAKNSRVSSLLEDED